MSEGEFVPGQLFERRIRITPEVVRQFTDLSGDANPIHVDLAEAQDFGFSRPVAHGAILFSVLSEAIGMHLPGPGAIWLEQSVQWPRPVFVGDEIDFRLQVRSFSAGTRVLSLEVTATNQDGQTVMTGESTVMVGRRVGSSGSATEHAEERVALVTGGSGGIGGAAATHLAQAGVRVALQYHSARADADATVLAIKRAGGDACAVECDLADDSAVAETVARLEQQWGRVDIVVHAASPAIKSIGIETMSFDDILPYLKVYVGGGLTLVRTLTAGMAKRAFGRFIFIGTSYMRNPPQGYGAYAAAKHALWGVVKSMALELGPLGITSNLLSPGLTITQMTEGIPQRVKEVEARKNPIRRLASVDDTGAVVAFLASEAAGYVNGVYLPVTGAG
jgi:3-oxoacyl-[acyl-carrier protein] reductase